jgi:hypothetical protein
MTGSFIKLHIKGQQDEYLTYEGNANFFIRTYEKHIDFAVEQIKVYFVEDVNFGKKISITFPKNADLLNKVYFCFKLPPLTKIGGTYASWVNNIGHSIIDYIDLEIGNRLISRYYGLYMDIWEELTSVNSYENSLIGKYGNTEQIESIGSNDTEYIVRLPFWFCGDYNSSLPIVSMAYHQVKIIMKLKQFSECVIYDSVTQPLAVKIQDPYLLADYIFLDEPTKLKVKSRSNIMLIEQIQYKDTQGDDTNSSNGVFKTNLPFNHPVKELLWVFIEDQSVQNNDWFNFSKRNLIPSTKVYSLMKNAKLSIEGKDYTEIKDEAIFRLVNDHRNKTDRHIYTLPFCLNPEQWEPSGSLNFSKIDSIDLYGEMRTPTPLNRLYIFARNHNWLIFENGMTSLLFIT